MSETAVKEQASMPSESAEETAESDSDLDRALEELNGLSEAMQPSSAGSAGVAVDSDPIGNASNFIMDIPIDVHVVIGSVELSVSQLLGMEAGEIIALDRHVGEPVDIMVNGKNIAKGEITVMENDDTQFGVKITHLASGQA